MMRLLTSRFSKECCVQLLDCRILVGFPDRVVFVSVIEDLGAQTADINAVAYVARLLRLAAAVDTSTRTAHDLDEMIGSFTGFDLFKQKTAYEITGCDWSSECALPICSVLAAFFYGRVNIGCSYYFS